MRTLKNPVKERPILFSAPMVRAILDGRKTQTRRAAKLPSQRTQRGEWVSLELGGDGVRDSAGRTISDPTPALAHSITGACVAAPFRVGGRLWVRETWASLQPTTDAATAHAHRDRVMERPEDGERVALWYRADGEMPLVEQLWADDEDGIRWRPSIYMPRWASRITLEVTGVRVERLHAITEFEAIAEGVESTAEFRWRDYMPEREAPAQTHSSARESFLSLWESINGTESLAANPWVWVVTFKRVTP